MPRPAPVPLTFYPAYCFSLSPTHNTWARLTVAEVRALKERAGFEGQNLYFHLNHPIKWVRLVGVIVAFDVLPTRWIMLLDDSSGALIEVTCGRRTPQIRAPDLHKNVHVFSNTLAEPQTPLEGVTATGHTIDLNGIDIGTVVKAKGGIASFRGEKQMHLERISIVRTTNEEAAAWAENNSFRKDILSSPWTVSEIDERRARRNAEGLDRERRARDERKRRKQKAEVDGNVDSLQKRRQKVQEERRRAAEKAERERIAEARRTAEKEERESEEDAARVAAEGEKKKRDKVRREHERRLRELEYERLMRVKENEGLNRAIDER